MVTEPPAPGHMDPQVVPPLLTVGAAPHSPEQVQRSDEPTGLAGQDLQQVPLGRHEVDVGAGGGGGRAVGGWMVMVCRLSPGRNRLAVACV